MTNRSDKGSIMSTPLVKSTYKRPSMLPEFGNVETGRITVGHCRPS